MANAVNTVTRKTLAGKIMAELDARSADGTGRITLNMKDGSVLRLVPCHAENNGGSRFSDAGYVEAFDHPLTPWIAGTPAHACRQLARWETLKAEYAASLQGLLVYRERYRKSPARLDNPEYAAYAAWHRSLFGASPKQWSLPKVLPDLETDETQETAPTT